MANMNVTYAELEQVASQLQSGQGELEGILARLQSLVEQLFSAGFQTDQASGAFQASYSEFTQGAQSAVQGLTGMSQCWSKAQQSMSELDSSLASGLN